MQTILLRFPGKRKFTYPEHFNTAYKNYADSMYGLILKSTKGNEEQAKILLCETFIVLFHEIYKQPSTTIVGFMQIFTIMLRILKNYHLVFERLSQAGQENKYAGT